MPGPNAASGLLGYTGGLIACPGSLPQVPGEPTFFEVLIQMARITVEDCLQNVPNLFQLVLVAAKRARRVANGAEATVDPENDKPTVIALREIAAGHVGPEILEEADRPAPELLMPEPEMSGELRAPHLGLGD